MSTPLVLPSYLRYWGKARPRDPDEQPYHPLAYHCLDVAAVAEALVLSRPRALDVGAELLGVEREHATEFVAAMVALHDVGKTSDGFQRLVPEVSRWGTDDRTAMQTWPHTQCGVLLWHERLRASCGQLLSAGPPARLAPLCEAVFGHHGRPATLPMHAPTLRTFYRAEAVDEATELSRHLIEAWLPRPLAAMAGTRSFARASWWLAGLTTLADWIGSNEQWFKYHAPTKSIPEYREVARDRAAQALRQAGLVAARPAGLMSFDALVAKTGGPSMVATPAQRWASETLLPETGPVLAILEDATGSGKTEAAQMLVHRLLASGRASGAYWAMPTQATANAMYARQALMLGRLFERDGPSPSLVLSHGQSALDPMFRQAILGSRDAPPAPDATDAEPSGSASCAAYVAHDRRLALLADLGAGTIDQAILGVLPTRFNCMRLVGLADKVLVLDEVHAYDAYVTTELQALVRFAGMLGGCVILLSATLPLAKRQALLEAWHEGASGGAVHRGSPPPSPSGDHAAAYPLAIVAGRDTPASYAAIAAPAHARRDLPLRFLASELDVVAEAAERVSAGQAVAWVRNTVKSCLAAADLARAQGLAPIVFHARFARCDRQDIEREIMRRLGRSATDEERRGVLVIATQVIEQSLDLDFDAMVTDLAPIDLVLQRAGRLWRHAERRRPDGCTFSLAVHAPAGHDDDPAAWLRALGGTARIYRSGVLWRTLKVLHDRGALRVPEETRALVERVYGPEYALDLPDVLQQSDATAIGGERAAATIGNMNVLRPDDGFVGSRGWGDDARIPTRLAEESVTVRLARLAADGTIQPWCRTAGLPVQAQWALSEVDLRATQLPFDAEPESVGHATTARVRAEWGGHEQSCILAPLMRGLEGGERQSVFLRSQSGKRVQLTYDARSGIRVAYV